jgi:hypothetical protein
LSARAIAGDSVTTHSTTANQKIKSLDLFLAFANVIAVNHFHHGLAQVRVGVDGVPLPRKPTVVFPLAPSEPFQLALRTVTEDPSTDSAPFHTWVIV